MRFHPLTIAFRIYQLVKSNLFIAILLFVINKGSEFWLWKYGRYVFLLYVLVRFVSIITAWFVEKYEWKDRVFQIHKGIFVKQSSTIPFSKIQNVTRKTTVFHKIVGLTSLTFETAMDGVEDAIHFEVISKNNAQELIDLVQAKQDNHVQKAMESKHVSETEIEEEEEEKKQIPVTNRTVHFTPRRKDLWKASFTSLSFLAIIPITAGLLDYVEPFIKDTNQFEGMFRLLLNSSWLIGIVIAFAVIVAVTFGIARTFIRYGKYEISSDDTHIYIDRGVLNESYFVIEKKKIQGLEMEQSVLKRLFGLAEVKLISSAKPNIEDGSLNVNSLYPFLPVEKAYQLIEELLPIYQINSRLERLPRIALWLKLLRPSWLWILATAALFYFKPEFLHVTWWVWSLVLLGIIVLNRILDYIHTRYVVTDDQVQWWHGGLNSRMFITKRKNVVEMSYSQSRLQKSFNVASVTTINRSTPIHMETIQDIPLDYALGIRNWYFKRREDVEFENKK
ncbi:PH domain-containing protein [Paucisalibacillus sp. EB02]|uniref:PH domain-containing protein n=1 Tax=Paucisalibacillus sp. EB02 TaxID=1347087 RepID=UPI0005A9CCAD|nr:PH domain-containing protein [Paucisalibacillus sp. EB02]